MRICFLATDALLTKAIGILLTLCLSIGIAPGVKAVPSIQVSIGDVTGYSGQQNAEIPVYLTNVFDEVCAFELWLQLSQPDLMLFQTNLDSIVDTTYWRCLNWSGPLCLDSVATVADSADMTYIDTLEISTGNFDTVGTLTSGWEFITSRSLSGNGTDIKVSAIADRQSIPGTHPGITPQQGGLLFKLLGDVEIIEDTLQDRTVTIFVKPFLDEFNFSRCDGSSIGILTIQVEDTSWYVCDEWVPPDSIICNLPREVTSPPADWFVVSLVDKAILDTSAIYLFDGSLTVESFLCGDANGDGNGGFPSPTVADITTIIDFLFGTGTPIIPIQRANVDCSTQPIVSVSDISRIIDHLFGSGGPLCCQ